MVREITDAGYVTLRTTDLDASVRHYVDVLGLREMTRDADRVFLGHGLARPSVELVSGDAAGVERIAFVTPTTQRLESLGERLENGGVRVTSDPRPVPGIVSSISFLGPNGHPFDVVVPEPVVDDRTGIAMRGPGYPSRGVRPHRLGHVTLQTSDVDTNVDHFAGQLLGFAVSDEVIGEFDDRWMVFLRCNNDHHALSFMKGRDSLHHIAFEVPNVVELVRLADSLFEAGRTILWGPGRHGAGDNIAMYHLDPGGTVVEFYTDMQRIMDDSWVARRWALDDFHFTNQWGGPTTPMELIESITEIAGVDARR